MEITAAMVKELRERSGAGMMECKKALTQNNGDIAASIEWLRKQGLAKADKKADRVAAEGRIALAQSGGNGVLVEINSETDFVAKDENFLKFADEVAQTALTSGARDAEALKAAKLGGSSVEEARQALVAKEKEISLAQMSDKDKQKPAEIQEKMIAGKIKKTLAEISLTGQPFVLDTNVTVGDALAKAKARVLSFHRIAVGEGIEKVVEDYAAEVMKQAGLA